MTIFNDLRIKLSTDINKCMQICRKNSDIPNSITSLGSFWFFSNFVQRIAGRLSIHSGRSLPLKVGFGILSFSLCSSLSYLSTELVNTNNILEAPFLFQRKYEDTFHKKEFIRKFIIGLGLFTIIETQLFQTALPSSLLSVGVFAHKSGSILATGDVATELQRKSMQQFGFRFGCHHCGNRQMLARVKTFIADHQPPTKIATSYRKSYFSRLTGTEMTQRLFPQCQSCFLSQGSAVREMTNKLVYHHKLHFYHFVPVITLLLVQRKDVRDWTDKTVDVTLENMEFIQKQFLIQYDKFKKKNS